MSCYLSTLISGDEFLLLASGKRGALAIETRARRAVQRFLIRDIPTHRGVALQA
jgi:hypothetical protein